MLMPPGRFEGLTTAEAVLVQLVLDQPDEEAGDVESPDGWHGFVRLDGPWADWADAIRAAAPTLLDARELAALDADLAALRAALANAVGLEVIEDAYGFHTLVIHDTPAAWHAARAALADA